MEAFKSAKAAAIVFALLSTALLLSYAISIGFMAFELGGKQYFCLQDDSMISMRYAYNLAAGNGLFWNSGDHVQGYTNLAWTLIMAALHLVRLPLELNSLAMQIISGILLLALCSTVFWSVQKSSGLLPAALAATLTTFNSSVFTYTVTGFEVTLQTLLLVYCYLPLIPRSVDQTETPALRPASLIIGALAVLVRPDSVVFLFWLGLHSWLQPSQEKLKKLLVPSLVAVSIVLAMFCFQYLYYGSALPNTYYLKVAKGGDLDWWASWYFILNFLLNPQGVLLFGTFAYLFCCFKKPLLKWSSISLFCLILTWIAYVFQAGGDTFLYGRFYVPIIPLLAICSSLYLSTLLEHGKCRRDASAPGLGSEQIVLPAGSNKISARGLAAAAIILIMFWQLAIAPSQICKVLTHERWKNASSVLTAIAVKEANFPNSTLIGVFRAGVTAYFLPDFRFHDMLGKSDAFIARTPVKWGPPGHNKWDIDYSLKKIKPDLLLVAWENITDKKAQEQLDSRDTFAFTADLWLNKEFRQNYQVGQMALPKALEKQLLDDGNPYLESLVPRKK